MRWKIRGSRVSSKHTFVEQNSRSSIAAHQKKDCPVPVVRQLMLLNDKVARSKLAEHSRQCDMLYLSGPCGELGM